MWPSRLQLGVENPPDPQRLRRWAIMHKQTQEQALTFFPVLIRVCVCVCVLLSTSRSPIPPAFKLWLLVSLALSLSPSPPPPSLWLWASPFASHQQLFVVKMVRNVLKTGQPNLLGIILRKIHFFTILQPSFFHHLHSFSIFGGWGANGIYLDSKWARSN